jgi:hypothetical protein
MAWAYVQTTEGIGLDAVSSDWPPPGLEAMDVHNTIKPA